MINAGQIVGYLDLDTSRYSSALQTAGAQLRVLEDEGSSMGDKFKGVGSSMQTVGATMSAAFTLPIAAIGTLGTKLSMDFGAQMSKVQAISGATGDEFEMLREQALQLGADTAFSASEAAGGMENLASAGFTVNEIMDAMPGMLDMAAAGGVDIATASDIAASSLRAFGLEAGQSGHVADVFAKVAADTNAGIVDMGEAMKYAAPVSAALGVSLEDTSAAIGLMSNAGIQGSQAGTTLRAAMLNLANPSKKAAEAMAEIGFNAFDSNGKMLPMPDLIGKLKGSMEGMTDQQKASTLATLFGQEAVSGMMALVEQGPDKLKRLSDGLANSGGAAKEMAEVMQNNLKGAWDGMMGSLETAGIKIGDKLTPAIQKLTEWIGAAADWFVGLSDSTQNTILVVGGIVAAIGPVLLVFGSLASAVGSIIGLFTVANPAVAGLGTVFGFTGAPIAAVGTAIGSVIGFATSVLAPIAAVGAALYLLYQNSETFRDGVNAVWDAVKKTFQSSLDFIKTLFSGAMTFLRDVFNVFKAAFSGDWSALWEAIKTLVSNSWNSIKSIFSAALDVLKGVLKVGFEAMKTVISTVWTGIKNLLSTLLDGVKTLFTQKVPEWANAIKGAGPAMLQAGKDMIQGLINGIQNKISAVKGKVSELAESIPGWLKKVLNIQSPSRVMQAIGEFVGEGLVVGMNNTKFAVGNKSEELASKIGEALGKVNGYVKDTVSLISKEYELWRLKNNIVEGSSEDMAKKLELQREKHEALNIQVANTQDALAKIIAKYGESSSEALKYKNELLDLQIEQAKLKGEIDKTSGSLGNLASAYKYVGQVMSDGKIYQGINSLGNEVYKISSGGSKSGGSNKSSAPKETAEEREERRKRDRANGMPDGYASGTDSATPGWHLVGEKGPELAFFNGGEPVINSMKTMDMLKNASNKTLELDYDKLAQAVSRAAKPSVTMQNSFTSPQPLDAVKIRIEQEKLTRSLAMQWGV